jgi:hypothetical protein
MLRDITLASLQELDTLQDKSWNLLTSWKKKVLTTDTPTKKKDLYELDILLNEILKSVDTITHLAQEIKSRNLEIQHKTKEIAKRDRLIRRMGGDPSLLDWYRETDFV